MRSRKLIVSETHVFRLRRKTVIKTDAGISASVAQRQSVGLGIERSRVRNSLVPSGFALRQGHQSALLGGPVRWESSLGRALTIVRP